MMRYLLPKFNRLNSVHRQLRTSRNVYKDHDASSSVRNAGSQVYVPIFEPGSGSYGKLLGIYNKKLIEYIQPTILKCLAAYPVPKSQEVFSIAEFGANDGLNTLELMSNIIGQLRSTHGDKLTIQVIYDDQEKNDFNSLFSVLNGDNSYQFKFSNVFPMAVGRSFYHQCVPDRTCDLIVSFVSAQILKDKTHFKDSFTYATSKDPEEVRKTREAGARDWELFLLNRTKELKPGGLMAVSLPYQRTSDYKDSLFLLHMEAAGSAWRQLRVEGLISQGEFEEAYYPIYCRTREEILAPLQDPDNPVYKAGLRLVLHDCPRRPDMYKAYLDLDKTDELTVRKCYADIIEKSYGKLACGSIIRHALRNRSDKEYQELFQDFLLKLNKIVMDMDKETFDNTGMDVSYLIAQRELEN